MFLTESVFNTQNAFAEILWNERYMSFAYMNKI